MAGLLARALKNPPRRTISAGRMAHGPDEPSRAAPKMRRIAGASQAYPGSLADELLHADIV
jgi:hypothetical protein